VRCGVKLMRTREPNIAIDILMLFRSWMVAMLSTNSY
jgi:hypothetical protein